MERVDATPKLLLPRLPSKAKDEAIITQETTLVNSLASIPFQWEEAPGKPRANFTTATVRSPPPPYDKINDAQCLDLPPRLLNNVSSPVEEQVQVQEGSCTCIRQSLSALPLFFLSKGSLVSPEEEIDIKGRDEKKQGVDCKEIIRLKSASSWSWGSFKGRNGISCKDSAKMRSHKSGVKINRVRKRSSFLKISHASSNILGGVYGSFKHVVPWGRRQK